MTADEFWQRVDQPEHGCWLWQGGVSSSGYGGVRYEGSCTTAHRLAYTLTYGPPPPGLYVLHECDTPLCCRPSHLRAGTQLDNHADAVARARTAHGERNYFAKLTEAEALEIRRRRRAGEDPDLLAAEFGVARQTVYYVATGRSWARAA